VERLLNEPSFHQNSLRLAASFERCGGVSRAADLIYSVLENVPEANARKLAGGPQS